MPLKLVRSDSNARLWDACSSRFLDELGRHAGPTGYASHLWIAHRTQRDLLLDAAESRELPGWLAPPFSFLSELPALFGIERRPIGLLTGRLLVSRLAGRAGREHGFVGVSGSDTPGRGHMVDRALSEFLPEGVTPDELAAALDDPGDDDFTRRRNAWLLDTYRAYADHLAAAEQFDPRSIHALVAEAIEGGGLTASLRGGRRLHVFGLTSLRGRTRLFTALAAQRACEVVVYLPCDPQSTASPADGSTSPDEWEVLAEDVEVLSVNGARSVRVQPVPDAVREAEWVATRIKRLLVDEEARPHEIAVIARSGRDDTRRLHDALRRMGVPSTARLRSRLHEVPALRAILQLFWAASDEWAWTALRAVLGSPYFGRSLDLRALDVLSSRSRPRGLAEWVAGVAALQQEARSGRSWVLERVGVSAALLERTADELGRFTETVTGLFEARDEAGWITTTRDILRGDGFGFREGVNRLVGDRWDIVRLDQRAVLALDALLREWADHVTDSRQPITVEEWYERLRRLLESNEIAISTPAQRGVQVLEAHEASLTPFRHAFVVHANEGVFPPRVSGGLFTETEREALAARGLPISTRDLTFEREHRLWASTVGSDVVDISYRTADASGIPRLASLFVPAHDRTVELARTRRALPDKQTEPGSLVTPAQLVEAETLRFLRVRRSGKRTPFSTPDPDAIRAATLRAFAEESRGGGLDDAAIRRATEALTEAAVHFDGGATSLDAAAVFGNQRPLSQRPTPWNGELRDPVILEWLADRFSPDREWSASQLEQYGRRPFDFLLERVLGLREIEAAADEANRLTIGGLVHSILEMFYRGRIGQPTETFADEARTDLTAAFDSVCAAFEESERQWVGLPHVWAATREELLERVFRFVEWEFTRPKSGTPVEVEFSFGRGTDRAPVDLSGPGRAGSDLPLLLAGRVDRVDRLGPGHDALRVVDYKSGKSAPRPGAFDDGAALQACLYMAALEAAGVGTATMGTYRTVGAPADRAKRSAADVPPSLVLAREIADRVRAGLFEAVQAGSSELSDWQPGRDIARSAASVESGTRFDTLAPMPLPGGSAVDAPAPAEGS